jgi:hypothetical protein
MSVGRKRNGGEPDPIMRQMIILERKPSVVIPPRRDENTSIDTIREQIPGDAHSLSLVDNIIR